VKFMCYVCRSFLNITVKTA